MIELNANIWDVATENDAIVITTNGTVTGKGKCVMGRGIAFEAKQKFPGIDSELGNLIKLHGNKVFLLCPYSGPVIYTLPVKHQWWEKADTALIVDSCKNLVDIVGDFEGKIYMPRPGCGNGKLEWQDVKPLIEKFLDDKFVVCDNRRK